MRNTVLLTLFAMLLTHSLLADGGHFNVKYNTPESSWVGSGATLYAGDWIEGEVQLWYQNDPGLGAQFKYTVDDWSTTLYDSFDRGTVDGNNARYSNQGSSIGPWSAATVLKVQVESWGTWWLPNGNPDNQFSNVETITVTALATPSGQTAVQGTPATTVIDLGWTQWNPGSGSKNVMILRGTDSTFTDPTDNSNYPVGNTDLSGEVIYNGSGTSMTDDNLSSGQTYYYKFYTVNNNYYSAGVSASVSTAAVEPEPSVGHGSATLSYTMTRGKLPATQAFAVTNSGGGTLTYTNTLTYGAGATDWLSTSVANSSLGADATESTTVSVTKSNLTAGTYYATNTITGNQDNGNKTVVIDITVSDVADPSVNSIAVDATHPATRVDLEWAKNGGSHDVMIVRSDDASFTAPTDTTTYTPGVSSVGGDPVVYRGSATEFEDTGRLEGVTYYYKLYSEHYTYYSAGVEASVTMGYAQARNYNNGTELKKPSVDIYLGDTHEFGCDSWASIDGNWGRWRVVIDTDADLSDGSEGAYSAVTQVQPKIGTSARFTSIGTWYWGMQVDYGATHGVDHWYVSNSGTTWVDMDSSISSLSVEVLPLPVVTGQSATTNGVGNPTNEIALAWTPQATPTVGNYQVVIVRKAGSAPSAPTPGVSYSVSNACGGGTVVYKGFDDPGTFTDTGLSEGITYHYAFYSENFNYYSTSAAASEATAGSSGPFVPSPTVFRFK